MPGSGQSSLEIVPARATRADCLLTGFGTISLSVHIIPYLINTGFRPVSAVLMLGITFSFLRPRLIFSQACWGKARSALARRRPAGEQRIEGAQSRSFNIAWQHETGHDHKVAIDMVVNGKFNCRIGNSNCRNPADSANLAGSLFTFRRFLRYGYKPNTRICLLSTERRCQTRCPR
jgi:hypothetical protein